MIDETAMDEIGQTSAAIVVAYFVFSAIVIAAIYLSIRRWIIEN